MKKLDCGCGQGRRPAPGYDAYCDVFEPTTKMPGPYYKCPMEDMSCFQDKEFDFARCHHSLEHVTDADAACRELNRIAKSGLISFPGPLAEMCYGRRDHNYYIFPEKGRLIFVPKFHLSLGVPRRDVGGQLNIDFEWHDSFEWVVVHPVVMALRPHPPSLAECLAK